MKRRSTDAELDQLLGAYALGAIEDDERTAVEEYLSTNAAARAEVTRLKRAVKALELLPDPRSDAPTGP
jgi:anti-sigma factor RsiW